jgi:hypothetical protein
MSYMPTFNYYLRDADEYYSSTGTFEETKEFIEVLSQITKNDNEDYSLDEDILIIEVKEGLYIRSKSVDWSNRLTEITKMQPYEGAPILKIIKQREWDNITRATREPINRFGDQKLVFWKVGF